MTTQSEISGWFDRGVNYKATHMVVVVDDFDHEDYPVYARVDETLPADAEPIRDPNNAYVMVGPSSRSVAAEYSGKNMQRVMEVYDLRMDRETQLAEFRAFHY